MNRLEKLNIQDRPVTMALLHYDDHFYDAALRKYSFKEALHLYLKRNGYKTIVFFSIGNGVHSFEKEMLDAFLKTEDDASANDKPNNHRSRVGRHGGSGIFDIKPQEQVRQNNTVLTEKCQNIWRDSRTNLTRDAQVAQMNYNLIHRTNCAIIIEPSEGQAEFTLNPPQKHLIDSLINTLKNGSVRKNNNRFIVLGDTDISKGYAIPESILPFGGKTNSDFWKTPFFQQRFLKDKTADDGNSYYSLSGVDESNGSVFVLPVPTTDDCKNAFQYWRVVNEKKWPINWAQMGDLMSQLSHVRGKKEKEQPLPLDDWEGVFDGMEKISYDAFDSKYGIKDRNGDKAQKELADMQGIDSIRNQFSKFCERLSIERNNPGSDFRPHMAFLGSPGTGKTTVARLFAEILKDKGLLSVGHLVQVSPVDFIGEHIGETRPKAARVCESAIGGVLFIDEAYGLHKEVDAGSNGNTYGDEAIEVIIQYMEQYKNDLIVIVAGYAEETRYMIKHGNTGMEGRFDKSFGYYDFMPYSPEVLFNIVMSKIAKEGWETTDKFRSSLKNIILIEHSLGQTTESNARYAQGIAGELLSKYKNHKATMKNTMDKVHIPEKMRRLIDPSLLDESKIFDEINKLVGQDHLKNSLKKLYTRCVVQMTKAAKLPGYVPKLPQLGFILMGASGTGKTTFAQTIANILFYLGLMPGNNEGYFTATTGLDILQSGLSAGELLKENLGKTLFIDEAYSLSSSKHFVADLVGEMQKPKFLNKLCIILAGYESDIKELMGVNQGLQGRFPEEGKFTLYNYTDEELAEILFRRQSEKIRFSENCRPLAVAYFSNKRQEKAMAKDPSNQFGNAREVGFLLTKLEETSGERFMHATEEQQSDPYFASLILPEDFPNYQK